MEIDFRQALDYWHATLQNILVAKPALANFAYRKWQFWNIFMKNAKKVKGGDQLEGHITLDSEGNAKHVGIWDADSLTKKNINRKYTLDWRTSTGGMMWNLMETSINSGAEKIYDVFEQQYKSAIKDVCEDIYLKILTGPTSSSDVTNPYSVFSWLPFGTAESTGGWTGYDGHYNDGSGSSAATFDRGGISSSAATNSGWAGYFADHQGNIDEDLLSILDQAVLDLGFQAPVIPETVGQENGLVNFSMYSSRNVITKLNQFYAKADDNMGYNRDSHWGTPTFKQIPFVYVDILNTARTSVYGTDPIIGFNHDMIYPVIHSDWNFTQTEREDPFRHNVLNSFIDTRYNVFCENPHEAGFLISQHPDS